jgi:hypothetical protein
MEAHWQAGASINSVLKGATIDIWQCDAPCIYLHISDPSFNTVGKKFLRSSQVNRRQWDSGLHDLDRATNPR